MKRHTPKQNMEMKGFDSNQIWHDYNQMKMFGFDLNQTTCDSNQVVHILFIECFDLDQIGV